MIFHTVCCSMVLFSTTGIFAEETKFAKIFESVNYLDFEAQHHVGYVKLLTDQA